MEKTNNRSGVWNWIIIGAVLIGGLMYLAYTRKQEGPALVKAERGAPILESGSVSGRTAPNWVMDNLSGQPVSLKQFAGHPVVLDFWATWCGPCQVELPWWNQFQKKYASQGLVIVGISEDTSMAAVRSFMTKTPLHYQIVWDGGKASLPASYGSVFGLPTTLYINRQGKITQMVDGLEAKPEIEKAIRAIL